MFGHHFVKSSASVSTKFGLDFDFDDVRSWNVVRASNRSVVQHRRDVQTPQEKLRSSVPGVGKPKLKTRAKTHMQVVRRC